MSAAFQATAQREFELAAGQLADLFLEQRGSPRVTCPKTKRKQMTRTNNEATAKRSIKPTYQSGLPMTTRQVTADLAKKDANMLPLVDEMARNNCIAAQQGLRHAAQMALKAAMRRFDALQEQLQHSLSQLR